MDSVAVWSRSEVGESVIAKIADLSDEIMLLINDFGALSDST
jgi:hypothetical protein